MHCGCSSGIMVNALNFLTLEYKKKFLDTDLVAYCIHFSELRYKLLEVSVNVEVMFTVHYGKLFLFHKFM